jgi:nucleotide-binding universal stress UspA family protein
MARERHGFTILVPVSLPESGPSLARLAKTIIGPDENAGRVLALHLRRPVDHEAYRSGLDEVVPEAPLAPLTPLLAEATKQKLAVEPISFVSREIAEDISAVAAARYVDLVLMGFHKPVFGKAILGGAVHRVLTHCETNVAILVDRGFEDTKRILVPFMGSEHDRLAMEIAARMAHSMHAEVTVLHVIEPSNDRAKRGAKAEVDRVFADPALAGSLHFRVVEDNSPVDVVLRESPQFDLIVIGVSEEWGLESRLIGMKPERIARESPGSLLIVRKYAGARASSPDQGKEPPPAQISAKESHQV